MTLQPPFRKTNALFLLLAFTIVCTNASSQSTVTSDQGGIIRGSKADKIIYLVFTGDEFTDGLSSIIKTLQKEKIKAGFFFTGRLYANENVHSLIRKIQTDDHYLGPHSDQHLLYCPWTHRDSLLVTQDSFLLDLKTNYQRMEALGIRHSEKLFIPPFEWWNSTIADWCKQENIDMVSFTPSTFTNADYTYPELGKSYKSSDTIIQRLLEKETSDGLNGAVILIHIGTDPRRTDKLYDRLGELIQKLKQRGYEFRRIDDING